VQREADARARGREGGGGPGGVLASGFH